MTFFRLGRAVRGVPGKRGQVTQVAARPAQSIPCRAAAQPVGPLRLETKQCPPSPWTWLCGATAAGRPADRRRWAAEAAELPSGATGAFTIIHRRRLDRQCCTDPRELIAVPARQAIVARTSPSPTARHAA